MQQLSSHAVTEPAETREKRLLRLTRLSIAGEFQIQLGLFRISAARACGDKRRTDESFLQAETEMPRRKPGIRVPH